MKVFILNMPERNERRRSVESEFAGKNIFSPFYVTPLYHEVPHMSHWLTFLQLVRQADEEQLDYFIFCEDDHVFTDDYDEKQFVEIIETAQKRNADILLGGVSWMKSPIQTDKHLFWLDSFNGTQFVVVFKKFYQVILKSEYTQDAVVTDFHLSCLSDNIFVVYPFISIQKEFGYSDITSFNNKKGYVSSIFQATSKGLNILNKVKSFYAELQ